MENVDKFSNHFNSWLISGFSLGGGAIHGIAVCCLPRMLLLFMYFCNLLFLRFVIYLRFLEIESSV